MSLNRKITGVLALFLCSLCLHGQTAYQGRLLLDSPDFSLSGGKLKVDMEVNYKGLGLPSNESITLTPLLLSGPDSLFLPSVLINGSKRQRVYERSRAFGKTSEDHPVVVVRDDGERKRRFHYSVSVPFREWMSGGTLYLRTQECGCNGSPAGVYTDRIATNILLPSVKAIGLEKEVDVRCLSWVEFLPALAGDKELPVSPSCGDGGVTLGGLFCLAGCYRPGSAEFNDLYDLAARLFPNNAEANINAAAVALSKRDTRKARHYLSRFSTLPAAFNNMGVLCLLEGNREKAELYLEMAVSHGVKRAVEVLGELHKKRDLY